MWLGQQTELLNHVSESPSASKDRRCAGWPWSQLKASGQPHGSSFPPLCVTHWHLRNQTKACALTPRSPPGLEAETEVRWLSSEEPWAGTDLPTPKCLRGISYCRRDPDPEGNKEQDSWLYWGGYLMLSIVLQGQFFWRHYNRLHFPGRSSRLFPNQFNFPINLFSVVLSSPGHQQPGSQAPGVLWQRAEQWQSVRDGSERSKMCRSPRDNRKGTPDLKEAGREDHPTASENSHWKDTHPRCVILQHYAREEMKKSRVPLNLLLNAWTLQEWFSGFSVHSMEVPVPAAPETSEMALQEWNILATEEEQ